jgi:hypothetical protein
MPTPAFPNTSLTLSAVDNLDATVTLTFGNATPAANVAAYYGRWNTQAGGPMSLSFGGYAAANGSGAGTIGPVSVSGGPGYFVFQAGELGTPAGAVGQFKNLSPYVFRPVVDSALVVHDRILNAVVTMILSLNLDGIGSAVEKVAKRWFPVFLPGTDDAQDDEDSGALYTPATIPMIQVAPWPKEKPSTLWTNRDDVGYPVLVGFFDSADPVPANNMPRNLKWRRQVAAMFRNQQLAGVPEVVFTEWEPDLISSLGALQGGYLVGAMGFTFRDRETRGAVSV